MPGFGTLVVSTRLQSAVPVGRAAHDQPPVAQERDRPPLRCAYLGRRTDQDETQPVAPHALRRPRAPPHLPAPPEARRCHPNEAPPAPRRHPSPSRPPPQRPHPPPPLGIVGVDAALPKDVPPLFDEPPQLRSKPV